MIFSAYVLMYRTQQLTLARCSLDGEAEYAAVVASTYSSAAAVAVAVTAAALV
jgi:hypothetical protein